MKYFKVIYGLIICQAPSKNTGMELEKRINGAEVRAGKGKYKRGFKYVYQTIKETRHPKSIELKIILCLTIGE